jgi:hypothetical protein
MLDLLFEAGQGRRTKDDADGVVQRGAAALTAEDPDLADSRVAKDARQAGF